MGSFELESVLCGIPKKHLPPATIPPSNGRKNTPANSGNLAMQSIHACVSVVVVVLSLVFGEQLNAFAQSESAPLVSTSSASDQTKLSIAHVIPLPHEISIDRWTVAAASKITVVQTQDASPLERAAAEELADVLSKKTGAKINIAAMAGNTGNADETFQIVLGLCDKDGKLFLPYPGRAYQYVGQEMPGAAKLFTLPNADQAYRIVPLGDHTIALVGTTPQGVYYASKTMQQLLATGKAEKDKHASQPSDVSEPNDTSDTIDIPMADVTDWPDLPERGLWGGNADNDIEWMADRKFNHIESDAHIGVNSEGRGIASISQKLLDRAKSHGIKVVPIITHLEQLSAAIFTKNPELKAVGDYAAWRRLDPHASPVCFAQPKAEELIADWLICLGKQPDATDAIVWLSEENVSCQCEKCKTMNPYAQQTQVICRAWEKAKQLRPDFRLRILLTQGSYASNDKILEAVPKGVGVTYYSGLTTYDSSRKPMIYPLLEKFAAEGGWLGCYPQLTASWRIVFPWTGPQFIKARMSEFADKRLQSVVGYATPSNRFYEYNITAAAEWSWNAKGRNERDFSRSWAIQQRMADPEKFTDWATMLGPVGWDVHGGNAMLTWCYVGGKEQFKPENSRLGSGMFAYFATPEHFDKDLAICDRAMKLAEEMKSPALVEETRATRGLVKMHKGLYRLSQVIAAGEKMTQEERTQAADALALADEGSREIRVGLIAWANAVAPQLVPPRGFTTRFADTVHCVDQVMSDVSATATAFGIHDARLANRIHTLGSWTIADFHSESQEQGLAQRKVWNADNFVTGPGRYDVTFLRDSRDYNVQIKQIRLVSTPIEDATQETELASDVHSGTASDQPKNTYQLVLKALEPNRHYFVVADLVGIPADHPSQNTQPVGHAVIQQISDN
jgi:hypothetical protein